MLDRCRGRLEPSVDPLGAKPQGPAAANAGEPVSLCAQPGEAHIQRLKPKTNFFSLRHGNLPMSGQWLRTGAKLQANLVGNLMLGPGHHVPGNPAVTRKVTLPLEPPDRGARQPRARAYRREPEESERSIAAVRLRAGSDAESGFRIGRFGASSVSPLLNPEGPRIDEPSIT